MSAFKMYSLFKKKLFPFVFFFFLFFFSRRNKRSRQNKWWTEGRMILNGDMEAKKLKLKIVVESLKSSWTLCHSMDCSSPVSLIYGLPRQEYWSAFPLCFYTCYFCDGFPSSKEACQCRRYEFDPWIGKILWRRKWQLTPVFLPGKSHGQRSLMGCKRVGHD